MVLFLYKMVISTIQKQSSLDVETALLFYCYVRVVTLQLETHCLLRPTILATKGRLCHR